jgi:hypothetical protein
MRSIVAVCWSKRAFCQIGVDLAENTQHAWVKNIQ